MWIFLTDSNHVWRYSPNHLSPGNSIVGKPCSLLIQPHTHTYISISRLETSGFSGIRHIRPAQHIKPSRAWVSALCASELIGLRQTREAPQASRQRGEYQTKLPWLRGGWGGVTCFGGGKSRGRGVNCDWATCWRRIPTNPWRGRWIHRQISWQH